MIRKLLRFISIQTDLDDLDEIHASITKGIIFKGTNLWILVFAIIIASVGLNMNSTAVIIGAMLISPLMGPINGIGYSIATYDFPLVRKAIKNFAFAVSASLLASTLYFSITPLSVAHSELLARTSPSIYDVLIALFGGLAGIVAISSKHKGNVIPGVAIATALMPPLCTAGYGLATGQFYYFFGAFYLFTINTVFIAISSVFFSQFLNFPIRTVVEAEAKRRVNRWITIITIITIVPSLYFGYILVQKERFTEYANKFIATVNAVDGSYLLKSEITPENNSIRLIYGGMDLDDQGKQKIAARAKEHELEEAELLIEQGFSINNGEMDERDNLLQAEIQRLNYALQKATEESSKFEIERQLGKVILLEVKALYPQVTALAYSRSREFSMQSKTDSSMVSIVVLKTKNPQLKNSDKVKLKNWLKQRFSSEDVKVFYEKD